MSAASEAPIGRNAPCTLRCSHAYQSIIPPIHKCLPQQHRHRTFVQTHGPYLHPALHLDATALLRPAQAVCHLWRGFGLLRDAMRWQLQDARHALSGCNWQLYFARRTLPGGDSRRHWRERVSGVDRDGHGCAIRLQAEREKSSTSGRCQVHRWMQEARKGTATKRRGGTSGICIPLTSNAQLTLPSSP